MTVTQPEFVLRNRRPPAGAFMAPKWTGFNLLGSLHALCIEISALKPHQFLFKRNSHSVIRKSDVLAIYFEEILHRPISSFSPSAKLCFEEMYMVLQRVKTLIEDCSSGAKMWLLMQNESLAKDFKELVLDLSTLLDIFPVTQVELSEDTIELVCLLRKQCSESEACVELEDDNLKRQVLTMLDQIKNEIVPDDSELSEIFSRLGIRDASSCREELENLEDELVQDQIDKKSKSEMIALIGLVRYAKCVLFGASMANSNGRRKKTTAEIVPPADFRCPISLDLMRDPVAVATGQTYDRSSINLWIESGHSTCPKTGQTLAHTDLIPNHALRNLISMWCRQHRIPLGMNGEHKEKVNEIPTNKTALEANRMTASYLIKKLYQSESLEATNAVIYELRSLAKTDSDSRTCIAEAEAIPLLVGYLNQGQEHPNLQLNAVTTILNLSILDANKARIIKDDKALNGVIMVLHAGATWEAKGNAAALIYSLSGEQSYRRKLGRMTGVVRGLLDLARDGPTSSKRDALVAIMNLAGDKETVGRLIEGGVMDTISYLMDGELPEDAVTILEVVVRRGGILAAVSAYNSMGKLVVMLRDGSDRTRESAAAVLFTVCRKGGPEMVGELAAITGIERVVWELMGNGTRRARRKAASLLRILRRWDAGVDVSYHHEHVDREYSTSFVSSATTAVPIHS